ncbi:hypothetical protein AB0B40_01095 [Streptomyces sp. NPDC042638]|uniref:hypothetical protein n=1 Tax=Streptomyces sp. NPDC042638 TaxID=3154333 RepID=UPI003409994D
MSGAERRLAVEHWLLSAAEGRVRARQEWRTDGVALLRCGGVFSVVQISATVVHAAVCSEEPQAVNDYLARALLSPAFVDRELLRYYILVGSSAGLRREWSRKGDDAAFMGVGHYLGVPAVDAVDLTARTAWCVEMASLGDLAPADAVSKSTAVPALRPLDDEAEGGRGLALVAALSCQWGTDLLGWGKRVWADTEPEQVQAAQSAAGVPMYATRQAQALYVLIVIALGVLLTLAVVSGAP